MAEENRNLCQDCIHKYVCVHSLQRVNDNYLYFNYYQQPGNYFKGPTITMECSHYIHGYDNGYLMLCEEK